MRPPRGLRALALLGAALPSARAHAQAPDPKAPPPAASAGADSVQDLVFLGDHRPVFLRLRVSSGPRPFRVAWMDSVRAMHAFLDRDGDGKVTKAEADKEALATLVRVANGGSTAMPRGDLDVRPPDGVVSVDELADALRVALGPFRVQAGRVASGKTDALFERLDRDGDGKLARDELRDAAATMHRFDFDEDELIDGPELEPFTNPTAAQTENMAGQRGRVAEGPPVVELAADDSTLRPARQILKKYDKGTGTGPTASGDNKLTFAEFAIDPKAFARADADADGALDTEELRRFLARATPDVELAVTLSSDASGGATIGKAPGSPPLPAWATIKPLGPGGIEVGADEIELEIHVDDGANAATDARRAYASQFAQADADNNGYVEKAEATKDKDHPSPLAALFDLLDRDGDGKLYRKELDEYVDRQAEAARNRLVLTTADQGRAIFSILDLNRDRRLGHREIAGTAARIAPWDRNKDGRVTPDEIPHHYQFTLARGVLGAGNYGNGAVPPMDPAPGPAAAAPDGPPWFRRMDRNRDGDVSRREFRGPKAQFDRLDRDGDGLLDAAEAATATASAAARPPDQ